MHCPVYHKDLKQARADGELEQWRISHHATTTCADQFRQEYERAYSNRQVPQFLQQMIDRYGMERCKIVIASTIQLSPHDGRYSQDMKDAAAKVTIPGISADSIHDRRLDYHIPCHPVTVNVAMRDLLAIEKQQEQAKLKSHKKTQPSEYGNPCSTSGVYFIKRIVLNSDHLYVLRKHKKEMVHPSWFIVNVLPTDT